MNQPTLPEEYLPIHELVICSNKLYDAQGLVAVNDFSPLLIGRGITPSIWIYVKMPDGKWSPIVENNKSKHKDVKISTDILLRSVQIEVKNTLVISGKMLSDDVCEIKSIDLRPIGINIHGDDKVLYVGKTVFRRNISNGAKFFVGFSEQKT